MIQSNGKNRAEDNVIRQMQVFHEKECEFVENLHLMFDMCKRIQICKIGVFTFEKNIFIIKILV